MAASDGQSVSQRDPQQLRTLVEFRQYLLSQGATKNTVRTYLSAVRKWQQKQHTHSPQEFLDDLTERGLTSTARLARAVLIQLHQFRCKDDQLNPWREAEVQVSKKNDKAMPPEPVLKMLRHAGSLVEARQIMIAKTILFCGLQAEEVAAALVGDFDSTKNTLRVQANGNLSDRTLAIELEFADEMKAYLEVIRAGTLSANHPLFFSFRDDGVRHLTREAIFRNCVAACGMNARNLRIRCAYRWWQQKMSRGEWAQRLGYQNDFGSYLALEQLMRMADKDRSAS